MAEIISKKLFDENTTSTSSTEQLFGHKRLYFSSDINYEKQNLK